MRIISLSTIPPRFHAIAPTLISLLSQRGPIDEIRLYVPRRYRRFPDYDGAAPSVPDGITVVRTEDDLGPASKVLFAAREFRGTGASILFCDDDRLFGPNWAAELFDAQRERPGECVALIGKQLPPDLRSKSPRLPIARRAVSSLDLGYRLAKLRRAALSVLGAAQQPPLSRRHIRKSGYADILQGVGGAVIRPDFFDDRAYDIPAVLWSVDDYWLSGMLARRDIPIWLPQNLLRPLAAATSSIDALEHSVNDGSGRLDANRQCIEYLKAHFGIW